MKKIIFGCAALLCCALSSCNSKDHTTEVETAAISINPDKLTVINDNGEFAAACLDTIHFLRLETTDDCLLADIKKVVESDSLIYVLDELQGEGKRVFTFDSNGKFKHQISKIGQGPDEYSRLQAFAFKSDTLYLLDDYNNKILRFDADGNFIDKCNNVDLFNIEDIYVLDSEPHILFLTSLNSLNPIVHAVYSPFTDNKCIPLIGNRFDRNESFAGFAAIPPTLATDDGKVIMTAPMSPTVYTVDPKSFDVKEFITIDCGTEIPAIGENEKYSEFESKINAATRYSRFPISVFQTGKWIIANFYIGAIVFDSTTNSGFIRPNMRSSIESDIFPFDPLSIAGKSSDGSLLAAMNAESFLSRVNEGSDNMKFMPPKEVLDGLTEVSNPVLIRYKFKN